MIKNLTLFLIGIVCSLTIVNAQSEVGSCPDSELAAFCDLDQIDGYVFTNPAPGQGDIPAESLCGGGAFHNPGWFSFVAGSEDLVLTVNPLPMTCDTVNGNDTGVQVALWEGCPDLGGECVGGDAACNDTPVTLDVSGLIVGEIYNLVIDGCSGSVCTVEVLIDSAPVFELPDLTDVDLADAEYAGGRQGPCDSSLPEGNFCEGLEVLFQVDDDFYETLGAEYYWEFSGPDAGAIEWNFGSYSGTGSPAVIGDLDGELGANGINVVFPGPGNYQVCLDNVVTPCDAQAGGPVCWDVNIIQPGEQQFAEYDVCALDLLAGWDPNDADAEDENGNPWIAGPITLDMVLAGDGTVVVETMDDCGCDFTQIIDINVVGSIDREEVELFVWECMLPYEWFEEEFIDLESLPTGLTLDLPEASAQQDWDGETCDSLVALTITPLTMLDTVIVGDCTSQGTEFTFVFTALDPSGNEIEVEVPVFEWIDASNNMVVANTQTALLETGSYFVNFESFIQDLNYMEDELAGLEELHSCDFLFGPYDLVGGSSTSPDIGPYDQVLCDDELDLLTFTIDTLPDTDYNWIIPASYNVLYIEEDSLAVSIDTYVPTDTLFVTAANSCGGSDSIPLPIMVVSGPDVEVTGDPTSCEGQEYLTGYDGDPTLISAYLWDVPGGTITTGDATSQDIGITYDVAGNYSYTLTVTDLDGCVSTESFNLQVDEFLPNPTVECDGDPSQIIFTWDDVPGATDYTIVEVDLPAGAVGTRMGNTYVITGINGGDMATITVTSQGNTDCIEVAQEVTCEAPGCDFSGIVNNNFFDFAICRGDTNNMTVQFDITLPPGYTGSFSGNGVTVDGLFDPDAVDLVFGPNNLSFFYEDAAGCTGVIDAVVTVNQLPNATFTPTETEFCVGEVIVLSGAATQGIYDYGPGAIGDFSGLSYASSGDKTIAVEVIDPNSGCSDEFEITVTVSDTVPAPLINCLPGTTSVDFEWDTHPLADLYEISVSINGGAPTVTTQNNTTFTQGSLMEGDDVEITVSVTASNGCNTAVSSEICTARTCIVPDITLTAAQTEFCNNEPLNPVVIVPLVDGFAPADGTFEYIGAGVTVDNSGQATFDPTAVIPGTTTVTFRYTNPVDDCVTSEQIEFVIIDIPVPDYEVDQNTICIDEVITVTMEAQPAEVTNRDINTGGGIENFLSPDVFEIGWDVPGTFDISVSYTVGNCPPETITQTITVRDTIRTPNVTCTDVNTDFVLFGWQDQTSVTEYEVYIDGQLVATQADSEYLLENLDPGQEVDIEVVAIDSECGNKPGVTMCAAQECVPPTWAVNVPDELCYTIGSGAIQLDVSAISNAMETGTITWVNPEVDDNNMFTPTDQSQDYSLTVMYTERNCTTDTTIDIRINVVPAAELALTSGDVICVGSSVSVESGFIALNGETPIWDFGGGTENGSGFGPYDVTFDTPGTYEISLSVDNRGCIGDQEMVEITVEEELIAPDIVCMSNDITAIDISWNAVDCAGDYRVLVDGQEVEVTDQTNYTITGLIENQEVDIIVEAISECACNNVLSQTFTCASKACIAPTWEINVPSELCYEAGSGPIVLDVTATSNDTGSGQLTWSSPEVDDNGNFTPSDISQDYTLTVVYTEGQCTFENTVDIRINVIPVAQLSLNGPSIICEGESVNVSSAYQITASETPIWDFDGGSESGSGFGPYDIRFDTPGNYTISLAVDNAGCVGDTETVQVEVQANLEAPVVDCTSDDINAIDLVWNAVDCASDYNVIVDGSLVTTTSGTSFTITGLNENQEVDVVVEAVSECACDNVLSQTFSCSSKPCDQTTWSFSNSTQTEYCLDANATTFTITATPDDLPGNGTGTWSGAAISDPSGIVDPSLVTAGTYDFVYSYEEGGCTYTSPVVQITFVEEPTVELTAMDPACPMDEFGTISAEGFGGEPGYSYSLDGGAAQSNGQFADVGIGSHTVEIIDNNGCVNTASIQLFAPETPSVSISGPQTVIINNDAEFSVDIVNADNIEDIIWTANGQVVCQGINCLNFTQINALADFELLVEVIYNGGCMVLSESFFVDVKEIQAYYIPNVVAYTGNGGVNSEWKIFIKGNETFVRSINIYTRWGNLIYSDDFAGVTQPSTEILLWDGFDGNDQQVDNGVYVYSLEMEIEGRDEIIVGDVTILR